MPKLVRYRNNREKAQSELSKAYIDGITRSAVDNVCEVIARLHRIVLFGKQAPQNNLYKYFKKMFPAAGYNHDFCSIKRMHGYKKQLIVDDLFCRLNIFIYRINPLLPAYLIEVTPKEYTTTVEYKHYLAELDGMIPELKPSSVEYTLDLFCAQPRDVDTLFTLVRRSLYVPYRNNPKMFDDNQTTDFCSRMNSTFYVSDVKVYERGYDDKKTSGGWHYEDLNRVRLEYTANRKKLKLRRIDTLSDLIDSCRFCESNKNLYKFMCFMSKKLPEYWMWDSYATENEFGSKGAFMLEYALGRHFYENLRQYMKNVKEFDILKERLIEQMIAFDHAWMQRLN